MHFVSIDADGVAGRPNPLASKENIKSCSAAQIDNRLALDTAVSHPEEKYNQKILPHEG
jgi:hypothetical protein